MCDDLRSRSVAIIGAGAAGAVAAAAFEAEKYFKKIRVFERRESPGGTWIYDPSTPPKLPLQPGSLPRDTDPRLAIPSDLPKTTSPNHQERYAQTPIYDSLTTNVPSIAMSFSDIPFPYGPFVPHHIARQYVELYFAYHKVDAHLSLNTTVEDLTLVPSPNSGSERWKLTLRKHDPVQNRDTWWEEIFDAVVLANGHYSIPFIPEVKGLAEYMSLFPNRVTHSKTYRSPFTFCSKKVLVVGNSASGHDVTAELVQAAHLPVYQSRRSRSRWDGPEPPPGIAWKAIIKEFLPSGRIVFEDDTHLDDVDSVVYCTGYKASYPFWNAKKNGGPLYDYEANKLNHTYLHTFFRDFPTTLAIVGMPRVLTFRSFEYQATALARIFSGRDGGRLVRKGKEDMIRWESEREERCSREGKKFHDIEWETGETWEWLEELYRIAGLPLLSGEGRIPPVLGKEVRWALENIRKYPEPGKDGGNSEDIMADDEWVVVGNDKKDLLAFI
ncbi:Flavin-dependent monooxygenase [Hyphodiscus hymeniophilus]|uniref:Flavin-dependent monooxygenase n=1 Tax=Hyphodiscus hymeniophilus TaxID=353542 RepID=A0A9P6VGA5_9HELO|nr:Flavin-dependent monooxygenase [Hyphodiscus hymeniophilus]